jgi:hypothetical protein
MEVIARVLPIAPRRTMPSAVVVRPSTRRRLLDRGDSGRLWMPMCCRLACRCTDSWEVCSASVSAHSWSRERSRAATALLILLGAARAGASGALVSDRTVLPFRSGHADLARHLRLSSARLATRWLATSARGGRRGLPAAARAFQLAEEIGFTGFLQHHWQDRYHPMNSPCTWRCCGRCGTFPTTSLKEAEELRR